MSDFTNDYSQLDKLSKIKTVSDPKIPVSDLKVVDIIENEDGTAKVIFDMTKEFKTKYMESFGLKRWSQKHFEKHMTSSIKEFVEKNDNRQVQNPDFLWTIPKDNDE